MNRTVSRGFTLIELMIVVAIVGVLAMIAVPAYREQAAKSRRADAITNLSALEVAQSRWRTSHKTYSRYVSSLGFASTGYTSYYVLAVPAGTGTGYRATARPATAAEIANSNGAQIGDKCGTYVLSVSGNTVSKLVSGATMDAKSCWSK